MTVAFVMVSGLEKSVRGIFVIGLRLWTEKVEIMSYMNTLMYKNQDRSIT